MIKIKYAHEPAPGKLGLKELYAIAVGTVIGSGVITLIVPAIKYTGYSAWFAYFCAIVMGFFMISPYLFVSSTVRVQGGVYSLLANLAGPKLAGVNAFVSLIQPLGTALFGVSTAAYVCDMIPAINNPTGKIVVGVATLTIFYLVNLMGG